MELEVANHESFVKNNTKLSYEVVWDLLVAVTKNEETFIMTAIRYAMITLTLKTLR